MTGECAKAIVVDKRLMLLVGAAVVGFAEHPAGWAHAEDNIGTAILKLMNNHFSKVDALANNARIFELNASPDALSFDDFHCLLRTTVIQYIKDITEHKTASGENHAETLLKLKYAALEAEFIEKRTTGSGVVLATIQAKLNYKNAFYAARMAGGDTSGFNGGLFKSHFSAGAKQAATASMLQLAEELSRITVNPRSDWMQVNNFAAQLRRNPAAQDGTLGVVFQRLETVLGWYTAPCIGLNSHP